MPVDACYAEILLPLHIPGTYTYRIPEFLIPDVMVGVRVVVPLGKTRLFAGLVWSLHASPPAQGKAKDILEVLDDRLVADERMRSFWEWMAAYYLCYTGDVMQAALPSAFRISSETRFSRHPDFDEEAFRNAYSPQSDEALLLRSLGAAAEEAGERAEEEAGERASEEAVKKAGEEAGEEAGEKAAEEAAERAEEEAGEKAVKQAAEEAGERAAERAGEKTVEKAAEAAGEKAAEKALEKTAEEAAEKAGGEAGEKAAEEAGEKAEEKAAEAGAKPGRGDSPEVRFSLGQAQVEQLLGRRRVGGLLRRLLAQGWIRAGESMEDSYQEKRARYYRLAGAYRGDASLRALLDQLEQRSPRQTDLLMAYLQESPVRGWVARTQLIGQKKIPPSSLLALVEKGVFEETTLRVDRVPVVVGRQEPYQLSDRQMEVLEEIRQAWTRQRPVLLYGWTGSGKTLLYVELIRRNLSEGQQALYLLPEIALTTQLQERLRRYLGISIALYHSRFSDNERAEIWQQVADGQVRVVLGARSAVFLPFRKLGILVVDEEHDGSFKQEDPAPRYQGRDSALVLAAMHGSRVVLGSATPSLESWYLAGTGKYSLVRLEERYGGIHLPEIKLVDLLAERRSNTLRGELSGALCGAIQKRLERHEQIILLQNRRGYVPYTECADCGWTPGCTECDITLTFHKSRHRMACHYCGFQAIPAPACPACGSVQLRTRGFGTEKIEEEVLQVFPGIRLARLDQDVARKKHAYTDILKRFEDGQLDLLVGTQMVAKGLDFERVTLVGVLNADQGLKSPDFRSQERTFQLLTQVSGRSGRRHVRGEVLIQTRQVRHPLFALVQQHNYTEFARSELESRRAHGYPPLVRLIRISVRHREEAAAAQSALWLAGELRRLLGARVVGPSVPSIARLRNEYYRELLLKIERGGPGLDAVKRLVLSAVAALQGSPTGQQCRIWLDVDPA